VKQTPAHRTDKLAEIVCSNSLKSDEAGSASHLLKEELRRGHSLVMEAASATSVPAGAALAVDRQRFASTSPGGSNRIRRLKSSGRKSRHSARGRRDHRTGPLTSDALTWEIMKLTVTISSISTTPLRRSSRRTPLTDRLRFSRPGTIRAAMII